jgi:hypothetical protein
VLSGPDDVAHRGDRAMAAAPQPEALSGSVQP